jgi:Mrp family chromosome partitioning ATPase
MVVLVVQHNKVDKKLVKRSLGALRKATDNLLGFVLNAVDIQTQGYHYYYYDHESSEAGGQKRGPRPAVAAKS